MPTNFQAVLHKLVNAIFDLVPTNLCSSSQIIVLTNPDLVVANLAIGGRELR